MGVIRASLTADELGVFEAGSADIPLDADYTWFQQGSCTTSDSARGLILTNPGDASGITRGKYKTAPAAPYDIYMRAETILLDSTALTTANGESWGILLRDGTGGDCIFLRSNYERSITSGDEQNLNSVDILRITNTGTISAQALVRYCSSRMKWLRANVDATTITFYCSVNGLDWVQIGTETIATFVGVVDQIGFATRTVPSTAPTTCLIQQFGTTAPA